MPVSVSVSVCLRACVRVCMYVSVCLCACVRVCVQRVDGARAGAGGGGVRPPKSQTYNPVGGRAHEKPHWNHIGCPCDWRERAGPSSTIQHHRSF